MHEAESLTDDLPVGAAQCRPDLHEAGQVAVGVRQRCDLLTRVPLALQVADEGGLTNGKVSGGTLSEERNSCFWHH